MNYGKIYKQREYTIATIISMNNFLSIKYQQNDYFTDHYTSHLYFAEMHIKFFFQFRLLRYFQLYVR